MLDHVAVVVGDPIEIILGELRQLAEGVARLRMLAEPATALVGLELVAALDRVEAAVGAPPPTLVPLGRRPTA